MAQAFEHEPVLRDEVVALLATVPEGTVVDATIGGAGHAAAILDAHPHLALFGLDRDPAALAAAATRLRRFGGRVRLRHARFGDLARVLDEEGVTGASGVLMDLGVSSPQLDRAERGFSYRLDGPLDMRMDPTTGRSAAELVNTAEVAELTRLFAANGEGRLARRLARAVVAARPVGGTAELARVVEAAVPAARRRRGHPARRVFQALRIAVNEELDQLADALPAGLSVLAPGGRMLVIAYHSGEDRLVKQAFVDAERGGCVCPPGLPCVCGARPEHALVFRGARRPSAHEIARNHRAESARLRAIERLPPVDHRAGDAAS
jgi:16S rRNA (cytosine1402-N4)-methyltransferase